MNSDIYSDSFLDESENYLSSVSGLPKKKIFVPKQITASKETLYIENLNLKEKIHELEEEKTKLSTKADYLNSKLSENSRMLFESSKNPKSPLKKFIRMTENLKNSVATAQQEVKSKKAELENLKKDIRYSQIHELKLELNIYKEECIRLKEIIVDMSKTDKEVDNKACLQLSLFENLQKENQRIRESLEKMLNQESKEKQVQDQEKKKTRISKKQKKRIVKLVDENLKLKNEMMEKVKEYASKENALKNEISYLRRKIEEDENQMLQFRLDLQKNEFFRVFYECRFCNFVVANGESVGVFRDKEVKVKNNKRVQTDFKCQACELMKKVKEDKSVQVEVVKVTINTGVQYDAGQFNTEKSIEVSDLMQVSKCDQESQYEEEFELSTKAKLHKQNSDVCIDSQELEVEFLTNNIMEPLTVKESSTKHLIPKMKKNMTHKIFYDPPESTKKEPLLKPRILTLTQVKPEKVQVKNSAKAKQKPSIPPFKLPSAKPDPVSIQSKLEKVIQKSENSNILNKNNIKHTCSLSSLRQASSKSIRKIPSRQSLVVKGKKSFSIEENDSKDIILEEGLYNQLYEDSLHSSDNSDIFINDNPLSSYHSAEKFWNSSQSRSVSVNKSRNSIASKRSFRFS